MNLVLGQVTEIEGGFKMVRAVHLPLDEVKKLPAKQIKGILYNAYQQLIDAGRKAEIAELEKLAQ